MAKSWFPGAMYLLVLSLFVYACLLVPVQADELERKDYIVYMGDMEIPDIPVVGDIYLKMILDVLGGNLLDLKKAADYLVYSFKNFKGFVVHITDEEAEIFSKMVGVVSVFPSRKRKLHTTRSWNFMGFPLDVERSSLESDVIVGVIDTGIWPESESFNDEGFGPPPTKWKGRCDTSLNFTCNNKIIGAQYFRADNNISNIDIASPRDSDGHGTHTASTVAGSAVTGTSFLGLGSGTARGGVPSARIAVYKVCWSDKCDDADLLAAFDTAISDGVDIISVSVGGGQAPYLEDTMAIGSFHAMQKGILTSASAGNDGPTLVTLENFAPWFLTVAASSIDRKFITEVKLGNGMVVRGISLNTFDLKNKTFPLIYGGDAPNPLSESDSPSRYCGEDTLDKTMVEGKIVLCDTLITGEEPFINGVAGVIMQDLDSHDFPVSYPLPASYLKPEDGARVLSYARNLTSTPYGTILTSVAINDATSPTVASFSSRGPNPISTGILKPDLTAPGLTILAAYSPIAVVSGAESDPRSVQYNIISGTSMSCPHASGVAAYIKSFHPTWSPAAIKSALMTTASPMTSASNEEAEFAFGSGHINPLKAVNPGLVYDAEEADYINFLCSEGLTATQIELISGTRNNCSNTTNWDLNYPSMAVPTSAGAFNAVFYRAVTNVGSSNSTYSASVTTPEGQALAVTVQPSALVFKSIGEKLSFSVKVTGRIGLRGLISASLVWNDGEHQVRSPVVVYNLS
ncbi:cucumisin-like [Silene latifolia]|uniref:cucumisin-like n=1 Tax=Silene latifolia TaxID=37657 RepID=UPI003D789F29